jgi:hypothetical protein
LSWGRLSRISGGWLSHVTTPENTYLEEKKKEQLAKKKKVSKHVLSEKKEQKKGSKGKSKKAVIDDDDKDENEEVFCLVCVSPYAASTSREVWVQCLDCKFWAHEAYTPGLLTYKLCQNCDSEYSD